jgi:hypothetical protein
MQHTHESINQSREKQGTITTTVVVESYNTWGWGIRMSFQDPKNPENRTHHRSCRNKKRIQKLLFLLLLVLHLLSLGPNILTDRNDEQNSKQHRSKELDNVTEERAKLKANNS